MDQGKFILMVTWFIVVIAVVRGCDALEDIQDRLSATQPTTKPRTRRNDHEQARN